MQAWNENKIADGITDLGKSNHELAKQKRIENIIALSSTMPSDHPDRPRLEEKAFDLLMKG